MTQTPPPYPPPEGEQPGYGSPGPGPASYGPVGSGPAGHSPGPGRYGPPAPAGPTGTAGTAVVRNPMDWVLLAAGPLTLIFSLMPFYTAKVSYLGLSRSASVNGWHGFFGWFGAIVALLASVIVALEIFSPGQLKLPFPSALAVLGGFGLAFVLYLLAWLITPGVTDVPSVITVDYGRGVGFYFGLIFILAGGVVAFLRIQRAGRPSP